MGIAPIAKSIVVEESPLIENLFDRAAAQLPSRIPQETPVAAAWVAKRMLELSEGDRRHRQTIQALLSDWIVNGELGELWMEHEDGYATFRDFLKGVGTEAEGNQLSLSVISDLAAIAQIISPYCAYNDIDSGSLFTANLWSRFRAAVPALRNAIKEDDKAAVHNIVNDVKMLPAASIRQKYRRVERGDSVGDVVINDDVAVFVIVTDRDSVASLKQVLAQHVTWSVIADAKFSNDVAKIIVKVR